MEVATVVVEAWPLWLSVVVVRTVGHLSLAEWHTSLAVRAGMAIARSSIARSSIA